MYEKRQKERGGKIGEEKERWKGKTRRGWELVPFYTRREGGVLSQECEKRLDARRRPMAPSLLGYNV